MEPVRVAVFGCGLHARTAHLKEYAAIAAASRGQPGVTLVATVDTDGERARAAAEEFGAQAWFTDHRAALEEARPELVSIVSPPAFHCAQALDSFAAGAHVLCEKPIAMDAGEAHAMVAAAGQSGKFLSMGLQSRHLEAGRVLRQALADGAIGEVYFTRVWCGHIMSIPGWGHFHRRSLAGGGVVMATTVHALDFALWVLGNPRPVEVTSFTHARLPRMKAPPVSWQGPVADDDVEDFAHAVVRFENGAWMSVESNWLQHPNPRPTGIEYLASDGRAALHPLKIEVAEGADVRDVTPELTENPSPVRSFLAEAVACARGEGEPVVRPEQIVQVQTVLDAIYRSAEAKATVPVEA